MHFSFSEDHLFLLSQSVSVCFALAATFVQTFSNKLAGFKLGVQGHKFAETFQGCESSVVSVCFSVTVVRRYPVFLGRPHRTWLRQEPLHIQRVLQINRTLYIGARYNTHKHTHTHIQCIVLSETLPTVISAAPTVITMFVAKQP